MMPRIGQVWLPLPESVPGSILALHALMGHHWLIPPLHVIHEKIAAHAHQITKRQLDYVALHPMFGWLLEDIIKSTFEVITQYACLPMSTWLKKQYKSPFPALNVHWHDEPIAMDTIYLNTPAINLGATIAQVFVGMESLVTDIYSMKTG